MTWFKVDDDLHSHTKAMDAGLEAMGLWVLAGSYCACHLTDGFLAESAAKRICPEPRRLSKLASILVRSGLWTTDQRQDPSGIKIGWSFHDWAEFQPTAEQIKTKRAKDLSRKKGGNSSSDSERNSTRIPSGRRDDSSAPDPTRPDPKDPPIPPKGGQVSFPPGDQPITAEDLEAAYKLYPRKDGKKKGLATLTDQIKTHDQLELFIAAMAKYNERLRVEKTDPEYIKHFSTFANCWEEFAPTPEELEEQRFAKSRLQRLAKAALDDEERNGPRG